MCTLCKKRSPGHLHVQTSAFPESVKSTPPPGDTRPFETTFSLAPYVCQTVFTEIRPLDESSTGQSRTDEKTRCRAGAPSSCSAAAAGGPPGRLGLPPWTTGLLFSVIKQVVLQGIWQREAQDLLTQEVHRGLRPGVRRGRRLFSLPLLFQVSAAGVVRGVGDPTGKHLFVQKDNRFHSAAANSPSFKPGSVLQSVPVSVHSFLADDLLDGSPDGNARQVLEAANRQGCCAESETVSLTPVTPQGLDA